MAVASASLRHHLLDPLESTDGNQQSQSFASGSECFYLSMVCVCVEGVVWCVRMGVCVFTCLCIMLCVWCVYISVVCVRSVGSVV